VIDLYRLLGALHPAAIGDGFLVPLFRKAYSEEEEIYVQIVVSEEVSSFAEAYASEEEDVIFRTNSAREITVGDRPLHGFKSQEFGVLIGNRFFIRRALAKIRENYPAGSAVRSQIDNFLIADKNTKRKWETLDPKSNVSDFPGTASTGDVAFQYESSSWIDLPTCAKILGKNSNPSEWLGLVTSNPTIGRCDDALLPEICYFLAAASLTVIASDKWATYLDVMTEGLSWSTPAEMGTLTAKRVVYADELEIAKEEGNRRCFQFVSGEKQDLSFRSFSWYANGLGYLDKAIAGTEDSTIYLMAVALDESHNNLKSMAPDRINACWNAFLKLGEITPERKLLAALLMYESRLFDDLLSNTISKIGPKVAPGLQVGLINSILKRSHEKQLDRDDFYVESLISSIRENTLGAMRRWSVQSVFPSALEEFSVSFDGELDALLK
jgi:hypothetical protein